MELAAAAWWIWIVAGFALMAAELLLPTGFFLFFFGAGAVVTGALSFFNIPSLFITQGLAFLAFSLLFVIVLRKPLLTKFHFRNHARPVSSLVGQTAVALEAISPREFGKVEMHGTCWSAVNAGSEPIGRNVRCRVDRVDGLTLHVTI